MVERDLICRRLPKAGQMIKVKRPRNRVLIQGALRFVFPEFRHGAIFEPGGTQIFPDIRDFGAFVGRARGIEGAGVCAIWDAGQMIVDEVTRAKEGEVVLTMNYLHNIGYPRLDNFARVKYVA